MGRPPIQSAGIVATTYRGLWPLSALYGRIQPRSKRLPGDARRILERVIFPAVYSDPTVNAILFVGVAHYTSWYPALFRTRPRLSFETIDPDPDAARWGAPRRHRIGRLESFAHENGSRNAYDLVIANGLFGFGTDSDEAAAAVIDACHVILKPSGRLLVGYSTPGTFDPDLVPVDRFQPALIPGLGAERYLTNNENRHSFACFAKV
jgi:hypothetical protein